jgi:hypothetical protein
MVWFSRPAFHKFIPHRQWKWNVHETVAVHVADFTMANEEFHAAKSVRRVHDFFPGRNRFADLLPCARHRHNFTPSFERGSCFNISLDARRNYQGSCDLLITEGPTFVEIRLLREANSPHKRLESRVGAKTVEP